MRMCPRCGAWPTHLVLVEDDKEDRAVIPFCQHHAVKVAVEAMVDGRDIALIAMDKLTKAPPHEDEAQYDG